MSATELLNNLIYELEASLDVKDTRVKESKLEKTKNSNQTPKNSGNAEEKKQVTVNRYQYFNNLLEHLDLPLILPHKISNKIK